MSGEITTSISGQKEMAARINGIAKAVPTNGRRMTRAVMKRLLAITQDRVPVKEGKLKATGRVRELPDGIGAEIVYGGDGVDYAVEIHENLDLTHKDGGQAKFVESVILEEASSVLPELAAGMDVEKMPGASA